MGYDERRAEEKRKELRTLIAGAFRPLVSDQADRLAAEVMQHFISVSAPYWEPPFIEFITMHSGGRHGATSTKPGNVTLNMRNLVMAIASGILTITGAMATPWALLLGALVTWDSLWSCLQLEIGEVQASVLWALWKNRDENNTVAKNYVQDLVNRERAEFGQQSLTEKEVEYALKDLKRMGCIKESSNDAGRWWLCESVRVSYQ